MTGGTDDSGDRTGLGAGGPQVLEQPPVAASDDAPRPWYRNRVLLALWALMVALLLTLIGYGIVELSRRGGDSTGPATTTSSTPTRSSTTSLATTSPTTANDEAPPQSPEQTPEEAPPPANNPAAPAEPPRHRHHLHVPSTITLPHTVITVPHGF